MIIYLLRVAYSQHHKTQFCMSENQKRSSSQAGRQLFAKAKIRNGDDDGLYIILGFYYYYALEVFPAPAPPPFTVALNVCCCCSAAEFVLFEDGLAL